MANERKNKRTPKYKHKIGKHSIDSIQKTAVLGTAHIIRKVLQCEAERWGQLLVLGGEGAGRGGL
jgi:hypothetical protein